jgi:predicted GNAT family acetyltransferase
MAAPQFSAGSSGISLLQKIPYIDRMSVGSIHDNTARARFELEVDGSLAFADYRLADGVLAITHTEVPQALRGGGVGSQLMLGVLAEARRQGLKVRPLCSFARSVIAQHPEVQDLLA